MIQDVMTGRLDFAVAAIGSFDGSNVRPITVLGEERNPTFPNVPSVGELGRRVSMPIFGGVLAPSGTPKTIEARLLESCLKAFYSPTYRSVAKNAGLSLKFASNDEFAMRLAQDSGEKAALIKVLGIESK
jgi:tripartite-type tricarboxylate transporter receptor subunit TctC